jgi:hypothetical protein
MLVDTYYDCVLEDVILEQGNARIVVVATLLIVGISATGLILALNSGGNGSSNGSTSQIASLTICGNTTDILYPELMEAEFIPLGGLWFIDMSFVNDSVDPMNPVLSQQNGTIANEDLQTLLDPLYTGLHSTSTSNLTAETVLEDSPHIAWTFDLTFTNGTWIYLTVLLTEPYILCLSGAGTPNHNLLDADVLEPPSAFDSLVAAINTLITNVLAA